MINRSCLAAAALFLVAACVQPVKFAPGAAQHGPYLDRSFEGYLVRAAFVEDVTVISVQKASEAPELSPGQYASARFILGSGAVVGPASLAGIAAEAAGFEAAALQAGDIPGWCPYGTRFAYLPPKPTSLEHAFKIRGSYFAEAGAFVFAGQCR